MLTMDGRQRLPSLKLRWSPRPRGAKNRNFYDQLRAVTARIPKSEILIPCGDWNGHVGRAGTEYREVHGGKGYGRSEPDVEDERILEYALAFDLLPGNTFQEM